MTSQTTQKTAKKNAADQTTRIAFIQSCWHKDIVDQCRISFITAIGKLGYPKSAIDFFEVPGVLEIPLQSKLLAKTGRYAAIVTTGLVVNGGIYRHEFVADAVIKGLMDVMLETETPVISAVLTPQYFHEHKEHHDFFFNHFKIKGAEAAEACAASIRNVKALRKRS